MRDALARAVAGELDKSTVEVTKALEEIGRERLERQLAKAVGEGGLTEQQAREFRERAESGEGLGLHRGGPGFGPPGGGHGPGGGPGGPGGLRATVRLPLASRPDS